jgi:hypothetical protein
MTKTIILSEGAAIMRRLSLILYPALLLAAAGASAQEQKANQLPSESEAAPKVQVTAEAPPFQFRDYQAELISGGYKMSNGWRMQVASASDGIVAQIGKAHPIRLVALSPDLYATRDGNVTMQFNRGPQGEDMLMSYVPAGSSIAQAVVVSTSTSLAQR